MEAHLRETTHSWPWHQMGWVVNVTPPATFYSWGKEPWYPLNRRLGVATRSGLEEKSFAILSTVWHKDLWNFVYTKVHLSNIINFIQDKVVFWVEENLGIHTSLQNTCPDLDECCYDFTSSWNRGFSRISYGGGDSVMPGIGVEEGNVLPGTDTSS